MASVIDRNYIWTKKALTYYFENSFSQNTSPGFTQEIAAAEFQKACNLWADPTGISFSPGLDNTADIIISWADLDGDGLTLANCEMPKGGNSPIRMKIDQKEQWTKNSVNITAKNFLSVVLHELGHGLGMNHSTNPQAIMFPFNDSTFAKTTLASDDVDGAKFLYQNVRKDMFVVNETDENVSWFAFNSNDGVKLIALWSEDLGPGEFSNYDPVKNGTGKYFIRFTNRGGGTELAGAIVPREVDISLMKNGSGGYFVQISNTGGSNGNQE